jgi:hypothetical protein
MRSDATPGWNTAVSTFLGVGIIIALSPLLVPAFGLLSLYRWARGRLLRWRFLRVWGRRGKVGVLVYSDSPNWKEYFETAVLPRVADRVVTINWSSRAEWKRAKPLEVRVFEHWAGKHEFNPMAIVVPRKGKVRTVRFWQAFKDRKHGRPDELHKQEAILFEAIDAA